MPKRPLPIEPPSPRAPFSPVLSISEVEANTIGTGNTETSRRLALYGLRRQAKKRHMRTTEPEICRRNYHFIKTKLQVVETAEAAQAVEAAQARIQQMQTQLQAQQARQADVDQILRLQTEVTQLQSERAALVNEKAALVEDKKTLKKERTASNKENNAIFASLEARLRDFESEVADLTAKNKKLIGKLAEVTKENEEMDEELGGVRDELNNCEARARLNKGNTWEILASELGAKKEVSDKTIKELQDKIENLEKELEATDDNCRDWVRYGKQMKANYHQARTKLKDYDAAYVAANFPSMGGDDSEAAESVHDQQDVQDEQATDDNQEHHDAQYRPTEHAEDGEEALLDYEHYEQEEAEQERSRMLASAGTAIAPAAAAPTAIMGQGAYEEDDVQYDVSSVHEAHQRLQEALGLTGAAASVAPIASMGQVAPTAPMGQHALDDQDVEFEQEEDLPDHSDDEEEQPSAPAGPIFQDESGSASMDESSGEEPESEEEEKPVSRPTSRLGPTGKALFY